MYYTTAGAICIDGVDARGLRRASMVGLVGFVTQERSQALYFHPYYRSGVEMISGHQRTPPVGVSPAQEA